jgi:hypothetical protein
MDFLDILREKAFLGREFLTWLWFRSDQTGGRIEISSDRTIEVLFLDRMVLDLQDVESPQTVSIRGEQSELREGLAALKEGKKIEEARIRIKESDNEFTMALKGTWFAYGAFRTPPVLPAGETEEDEGPEATFLEKVYLVEEGLQLVDSLFEYFLRLRLSEKWETQELPNLRRWIAAEAG